MTKDELYNQLLERVQKEGGYVRIKKELRPIVTSADGEENIVVAGIFEGTDDSSPLKVIDSNFYCYDLYDYITAFDIITILKALDN